MRLGIPKNQKHYVTEDGKEDNALRKQKAVLWTGGRERSGYYLATCEETPSRDVCGECVIRTICNFSKSNEITL